MKKIKFIAIITFGCVLMTVTSCRDDMAEINTDPSQISEGNIPYLFAQAVIEFEPSGYLYWFYNAPMMYRWGQMGVPTGGFTSNYTETTATGEQGSQYIRVLNYARDIQYWRSQMEKGDSEKYANTLHVDILTVYLGYLIAICMVTSLPRLVWLGMVEH